MKVSIREDTTLQKYPWVPRWSLDVYEDKNYLAALSYSTQEDAQQKYSEIKNMILKAMEHK
jgi:hypothetical protein